MFQSIKGQVCEDDDRSKYNPEELKEVRSFIDELLATDNRFGKTVECKVIGIVTPYSAQARKIADHFKHEKYNEIMVGTGPIAGCAS